MGRHSKSPATEKIETLLKRLKRQSQKETTKPPEEASAALGRHIGTAFVTLEDIHTVGDEIVQEFVVLKVNPSLVYGFFEIVASSNGDAREDDVMLQCLPRWICHCDQTLLEQHHHGGGTAQVVLTCAIGAYAELYSRHITETKREEFQERLLETYFRLKLSTCRTCLTRTFGRLAAKNFGTVRLLLSPLMAACVISKSSLTDEKLLFLQALWRECWTLLRSTKHNVTHQNDVVVDFISWMLKSLHLFLLGIERVEQQATFMEMAHQWLVQWTDVVCHIIVQGNNNKTEKTPWKESSLSTMVDMALRDVVPHFYTSSCFIPMDVVLQQLLIAIKQGIQPPSESVTLFGLSSLALSTPSREDVSGLLNILAQCRPYNNNVLIHEMMYSLTCVYGHDATLEDAAMQLRQATTTMSSTTDAEEEINGRVTNILHLLEKHPNEEKLILRAAMDSLESDTMELSATQQNAALLLGIALLRRNTDQESQNASQEYLTQLVKRFPHLGITLLPVVMEYVQSSFQDQDGTSVLYWLEFLCNAVVLDPHCAQEVWNLVGVKLVEGNTTIMRSVAIRLYPRLCRGNKKLYRRVIDALGVAASSSAEPEVRLAVVATISDLAKEDRIRDVSDVIGWIQTFLADENASVVHYAIMSLHYLVVAEELDFDVVIKVLNKRLCPVTNLQEVLKLSDVCLEALVLLLGDGECEVESSDDDERGGPGDDIVSPQVTGAVQVLIELALSPALTFTSNETTYSTQAISRIRENICKSLSNYSLQALGVEEDGVRAATADEDAAASSEVSSEAKRRYHALTKVVLDGLCGSLADPLLSHDHFDPPGPEVELARRLIDFEEVVLGPSLWQKGMKATSASKSKTRKTKGQKAAIAALPSPEIVYRLHKDHPSTATALASLLCFELQVDGKQTTEVTEMLAQLSEIASDISMDSSDPMFLALGLQGWLHSMGGVWNLVAEADDSQRGDFARSIPSEIQGWRQTLEQVDHSYLALASFSIFVPDSFSQIADEIQKEVTDACREHFFENQDVAHICLGLVGVRAARNRDWPRLHSTVHLLEDAAQFQGGQGCFGAYYGLALIAQALGEAQQSKTGSSYDDVLTSGSSHIGQIVGTIVGELMSCLHSTSPALINLVACLKSGKASPDLVSSISSIEESSLKVHDSMRQKVESLCLSLALCVSALQAVCFDLLLASYQLLEGLPWGCGKGTAISSALIACHSSKLLKQQEVDNVVKRYNQALELAVEAKQTAAVGDSMYALCVLSQSNTTSEELTSLTIHRLLENGDSPDFARSSQFLYAIAATVGSTPCLGTGPFQHSAQVRPTATEDRITEISGMLLNLANDSDDVRSREAATMVLGLLSSMKIESKGGKRQAASMSNVQQSNQSSSIKYSKIPQAKPGTVLAEVLTLVKQYCESSTSVSIDTEDKLTLYLPRLLRCLKTVSLPGQFVSTFLEPILNDTGVVGTDAVEAATLELLVSQTVGRRRAAFDGREFINVTIRISLLPVSSLTSLLGESEGAALEFLTSLPKTLPKFPTDSVGAAIENAWHICRADRSLKYATKFLASLQALLRTATSTATKGKAQMSPRTINTIRKFILQTVYSGICELGIVTGDNTQFDNVDELLEAYSDCLRELPLEVLDEMGFAKNSSSQVDHSILSITCTMMLTVRGYFEESDRRSREVTKAVAWFLREHMSPEDLIRANALRRVAFEIAFAAKGETSGLRKDIAMMILESLVLVKAPNRFLCLELLAMMMASWVKQDESSSDFSLAVLFVGPQTCHNRIRRLSVSAIQSISQMLVHALPRNLGTYCRAERSSAMVINRVWNVYNAWSKDGADQEALSCLRRTLTCCRGRDTSEQEYTSLATKMLQ